MHNKIFILSLILTFIPILSIYPSDNKIICPVCGAENPPNAKFCWKCGAPLKLKKLKKKEIKKEKIPQKIAPTDSLMQTLREIKDLLKDIKEELSMYSRPKISEMPKDTLRWAKPKTSYHPVVKKDLEKKVYIATLTGCIITYMVILMLIH